ncbi:hypothetical protein HPB50_023823 [Hyalomma asiaticum]|uniref:Uncharacterized protein n=1 Tax=Hyalomma asiaticum TaxID=266040 RepID=A0ACB7TMT7_HYAAI|nr:hypothetical protein HPB50_023823 [Hyalomma asiaticum]
MLSASKAQTKRGKHITMPIRKKAAFLKLEEGFVFSGKSASLDEGSAVEQLSGSEQLINDVCTAGAEMPLTV